jgi:hypothetical protein
MESKMQLPKKFQISAFDLPYEEDDDELLKEIYSYEDILNLKIASQNENLPCLSFISLESNTYFNEKQIFEIINNELPKLKEQAHLNISILDMIMKISNLILHEGYSFLKIKPI